MPISRRLYATVTSLYDTLVHQLLVLWFTTIRRLVQLYMSTYPPTRDTTCIHSDLQYDLKHLEHIFGGLQNFHHTENSALTTDSIAQYYKSTANYDYKFLEMYVGGSGMHTLLEQPALVSIGTLQQAAIVLSTINAYKPNDQDFNTLHATAEGAELSTSSKPSLVKPQTNGVHHRRTSALVSSTTRVLELGCGKGTNTLFLAQQCNTQATQFVGIDLTPLNVDIAKVEATACKLKNVAFHQADYTTLHTPNSNGSTTPLPAAILQPESYDLIFAIESLCYMKDTQQQKKVMKSIATLLKPHGKLVIIDGYRTNTFDRAPPSHQMAMKLAELGYRCVNMPCKQDWINHGKSYGMQCVAKIDQTAAALPFWQEGRIGVRFLLHFWPILRLLRPYVAETAANFLAMAMTSYAFELRTAEYGTIVLQKQSVTHSSATSNGVTTSSTQ